MSAPSSWLVPKDRVLKAAKSAIYNIIPDGREMSYISAAIESVVPSLLLSTDLSSIYFSMADVKAEINDKPLFGTLPVVAKFHTTGDAIVLGLKHSTSGEYLWAVRVESLLEWTPPSDPKKDVEEDALMFPLRLPHSDLAEFTPVVNTADDVLDWLDIIELPRYGVPRHCRLYASTVRPTSRTHCAFLR